MSDVGRPSRNRDRNHQARPHRDRRDRDGPHEYRNARDPHQGGPAASSDKSQPHHYARPVASEPMYPGPPSPAPEDYFEASRERHPTKPQSKCSYVCSRRGIVHMAAIGTTIIVLICVAVAQAVMSGFSSMGGLATGSFSLNSDINPFQGTELQEVRDLDMQYSQMRAPGVYGGAPFSIVMGVITLFFLISGAKPLCSIPIKLLVFEFFFDVLACVGYIVAVGLYLHFVIQVNATDVCKKRERLYARQGYTWMNCDVQGGDAAVALFGLITSILYFVGSILCALTIRLAKAIQRDMYLEQNQPEPEGRSQNGKQRDHGHRRHQRNIDPDLPVSTLV
ncbi:MARVEL domain-containing protein 3-like [Acipenser ruthenus]|nr:MARVEL domain-containing protein 3-like [Acipenser ruthenus]XP_058878616.1 MARVEL domain-containing protein 3-like [Acipenser ruthenus]